MTWFGFLVLFGLICVLFTCQGRVYPPSSGNEVTLLPGSTGKIVWTFDDNISDVAFRSWSFASTDGSIIETILVRIAADLNPDVRVSFPVVEVEKPSTLVLKNVDRRYDGKYKFSLNAIKQTFSEVDVIIVEKPNATLNCSSSVTPNEGDNFTCQCKGEGGNPPANVTWFKDGVKFTDVGTERQTLNLLNVGRADNGTYKCVATSYHHENYTEEKSIQVTVYFKPVNAAVIFSKYPAEIDKSVTITCTSEGFPKPSFTIYHNDTKVVTIGNSYYNIPKVEWKDAGTYKCIAINALGNDSNSKFLEVTEKLTGPLSSLIVPSRKIISGSDIWTTSSKRVSSSTNMEKNVRSFPAKITTCTPVITSTCISTTSGGPGKNQEDRSSGTEWYIIVVTLVSGIIIGIILSYIVFRVRCKNEKPQLSNPEPATLRVDSTYQELDLKKMNKEDNYQSLRVDAARNYGVNDDESNYTELSKTREVENNYQTLT